MSTTQDHLDRFYVELQAWIDGGCKGLTFTSSEGLCYNLDDWARRNGLFGDEREDLLLCQKQQLVDAGRSGPFPFNLAMDNRAYGVESRLGEIFTNPARLAWIKARADEAKARQAVTA